MDVPDEVCRQLKAIESRTLIRYWGKVGVGSPHIRLKRLSNQRRLSFQR
ncbi:MAG: hypothetical protein HC865_25485 [Cyanobacteria bacterium RU_5_0]|nr:hypothetical protein [Cyanobacteria bacterium RU_5_0]